ncbi:MAG: peptidylprolyl isomerase [Deltaproteobacteria bacterium]|nr:peptidylprolyl isomerase [Deltaproteobacteria bacterium]
MTLRTRLQIPHLAISLSALMTLSLLYGCGGDDEGQPAGPLVTVGDHTISDQDFEAYLRFKHAASRDQAQVDRTLEEFVGREQLALAIEEHGELDTALIQTELHEFKKQMLISRYFEQFLRANVTDTAIENFYNTHAADYEDHKVHVAHILVRVNRRMSDEERQAARTKIQEAYSQLEAGADFAELARSHSEDRVTSNRGGDLGFVREGSIAPQFSEAAFGLETVDAYTRPFETPFGWHIVKLLEAAQTVRRPLSAVQGEIRTRLRTEAKQAEVERLRALVEVSTREGGFAAASLAGHAAPGAGATPAAPTPAAPGSGGRDDAADHN